MVVRLLYTLTLIIIVINLFLSISGYAKRKIVNKDYFPFVSVLCCAWNEEKVIERKIRNYLSQNYPKNKYEIIIVDNGSTDNTYKIAQKYKKTGKIKLLRLEKHEEYKSIGFDKAVRTLAKGEIILHSDADTICERDWIRKMVFYFKDKTVSGVAGKIGVGNYKSGLIPKLRSLEFSFLYDLSSFGTYFLSGVSFFCGANYGLRKKDLLNVGGHGKDIVEDFLLGLKFISRGMKIVPANAFVYQEEMTSFSQFVKQRKRWYYMIFNSKNYNKYVAGFFKKKPLAFILNTARGGAQISMMLNFILLFFMPYHSLLNYFILAVIYLLGIESKPENTVFYIPFYLILEPFMWTYVILALLKDKIKNKNVRWEKIYHKGEKFPKDVLSYLGYNI
ncbi:MAG: glycosyltransferase [Candidatus Nanoarchaeia archaeon]|nr:glycosyltransferase [Candidatus Nanoarchaeia archaeon]